MGKGMDYRGALAYLERLNTFGVRLGLSRILELLKRMGNPQERYRTVHVTGTNGKGSVSAMLAAVLQASGIRTGLYSSPHLWSYTERMAVDGRQIGEQEFADCADMARKAAASMVAEGMEQPTQFEVLTAMAFRYFAEQDVEYAVIEVGLGGLLDSTNVIVPEVSVITNVSMEHADRCGGTLEGVARHKAGIIKDGVPVVTAAKGVPLGIVRDAARARHTNIFVLGQDFSSSLVNFDGKGQNMAFCPTAPGCFPMSYCLRLLGGYQAENSAIAVMAAQLLGQRDARITREAIADGLARAEWPGRFERVDIGAQKILVDGAHNPAGMAAFRKSLDDAFPEEGRVFLLGILRDKDAGGMLGALLRPEDDVVVTAPCSDRAAAPEDVAQLARAHAQHVEAYADHGEALGRAMALADGRRLLCVAGSLYLIGEIRHALAGRRESSHD